MPPRPIFPKKITKKNLEARKLVAVEWWQDKLDMASGKVTSMKIINKLGENIVFRPGQFILFRYLAKWRHDLKKLPYWDRFPLAVILETGKTKKGDPYILSLNLHYLPMELRHLAFQRIQQLVKVDNPRKNTRANITYAIFKSMANLKICKAALKMHLIKQMRSKIVRLTWDEMAEFGIYLDLEQWMRGTRPDPSIVKRVYRDSRRIAKGGGSTSSSKSTTKQTQKKSSSQASNKSTTGSKKDSVMKAKYQTKRQQQKQKTSLGNRWKQRQQLRQAARKAARRNRRRK